MTPSPRQEETPLLLLFLEESGSGSPRRKNFFGNNSRYNRISEGASTVFTQWPGQVTICCLATFVFLIFFLTFLMIMLAASFHPTPILPRCLVYKYNENISRIYLVHHSNWQRHQFETIEEIVHDYPNIPIEILDLWNRTHVENSPLMHLRSKRNVYYEDQSPNERYVGHRRIAKRASQKINRYLNAPNMTMIDSNSNSNKVTCLKELLYKYPIIIYNEETMNNYFSRTPLYNTWKSLNLEMAEFAARVLQIWEFGGISFKLPEQNQPKLNRLGLNKTCIYDSSSQDSDFNIEEDKKLGNFIRGNITSYLDLPDGVVSIDDNALHMETKTPCHAFFGEMLVTLRKCNLSVTVGEVVNATLKVFCMNGDVTDDFCFN